MRFLPIRSAFLVLTSALVTTLGGLACAPSAGLAEDDVTEDLGVASELELGQTSAELGIPGIPGNFVANKIAVGVAHTCAILSDNTLACWGSNASGRLGLAITGPRYYRKPQATVPSLVKLTSVSAGEAHTCVVRPGGLVSCWGANTYGQINPRLPNGNPPTTGCPLGDSCATPNTVSGITDGIQVAAGYDHSCVRRANDVRCWGRSAYGLLYEDTGGSPSLIDAPDPLSLSAGEYFTCFRTYQRLAKCWGRRPTPDGTSWATDVHYNIGGGSAMVSVGRRHACTLHSSSGTVWCMGESTYGQAGVATSASQPNIYEPAPVAGINGAIAIAAGARHTCALFSTGRIKCWGANDHGQLGIGELTDYMPPIQVVSSVDFTAIAAGGDTTCALTATGATYCWGRNDEGQTGVGETSPTILTPQRVAW